MRARHSPISPSISPRCARRPALVANLGSTAHSGWSRATLSFPNNRSLAQLTMRYPSMVSYARCGTMKAMPES
ncbi:Uncharacterised protein [Bordetella pertussis]|nr:Uncharacterised protein [Bordetella pertussis]